MNPVAEAHDSPVIVVKYGGAAFDSSLLSSSAARNLATLARGGRRVLLVHGGGRAVTEEATRRGLVTRFVDGLRATDREMLDVVRTVMVGRLNKDLVGQLGRSGIRAIGLSGEDAGLIRARTFRPGGGTVDLGYVGEPAEVRTDVLHMVWRAGMVPVVASVAADEAGVPHNINADSAAAALAAALCAERLVYVTDVDGLLRDPADPKSRIVRLSSRELDELLRNQPPKDGMLPKLTAALDALRSGVRQVRIIGSRQEDAVLLAATTDTTVGTTFYGHE
ncbi:acetylglutamate kinase [Kitasatospora sp. NPDC008050]|uniref:acetylglutamate kinase n=1 Tax=Kitasatospora sp. NPDC008050 TaxID=3364021 RepID=UPI0036F15FE2